MRRWRQVQRSIGQRMSTHGWSDSPWARERLGQRRSVDEPLRELVISFGRSGYIALYRFKPESDEVRILAIRHQREIDYSG